MDRPPAEPGEERESREPDSRREATRAVWETPLLEELSVQLSASMPNVGGDGSVYADCTRS